MSMIMCASRYSIVSSVSFLCVFECVSQWSLVHLSILILDKIVVYLYVLMFEMCDAKFKVVVHHGDVMLY